MYFPFLFPISLALILLLSPQNSLTFMSTHFVLDLSRLPRAIWVRSYPLRSSGLRGAYIAKDDGVLESTDSQ